MDLDSIGGHFRLNLMKRRSFITTASAMTAGILTLRDFDALLSGSGAEPDEMPSLFVGHGSPMNAIEENEFSRTWRSMGQSLPRPKAILCVSAHWMTPGHTYVTAAERPRTIHDFGGFPEALFKQQYPAPGATDFARDAITLDHTASIQPGHDWGFDHGCWSVLLQMYPGADIPVFQLSLDLNKPPQWHYELSQRLKSLRKKGVMVMGSGNIVHNLGRMQWSDAAYDWALEFDTWSKQRIAAGDHRSLIDYHLQGELARLAIPSNEHYLPLLYVLAMQDTQDQMAFFNEKTTLGSVSMRSVIFSR